MGRLFLGDSGPYLLGTVIASLVAVLVARQAKNQPVVRPLATGPSLSSTQES
jgi:UDP-N-acetylmuramyl pentapeptide phosphotransferase/UDP-N-acetylglucosamine-1-phosphate transferase